MLEYDAHIAGAAQFCGYYEVCLPDGYDLAPDTPCQGGPADEAQDYGHHEVYSLRSPFPGHGGGDTHPQGVGWDGADEFGETLEEVVNPAAEVSRHTSDEESYYECYGKSQYSDGEGTACGKYGAGEYIPGHGVGSPKVHKPFLHTVQMYGAWEEAEELVFFPFDEEFKGLDIALIHHIIHLASLK